MRGIVNFRVLGRRKGSISLRINLVRYYMQVVIAMIAGSVHKENETQIV